MALFGPINPEPQQYFLKGMSNVEQLSQQQLQNALLNIQKQYMPQMQEAEIGLKKGQEFENRGRGANYFAEASLAPSRNALLQAQAGHERAISSPEYMNSLIGWRNALTQTAPTRALTTAGKSIVEQANIDAGLLPTGKPTNALNANIANVPLKLPDSPTALSDQYDLYRQKITTDTDTRKRNLFATNIEKTLKNINVDDLVRYSGMPGKINQTVQAGLAPLGKESKEYDNYLKAQNGVEFLTSQVRQFYGESIQPSMKENLRKLNDPTTWAKSPKLAKEIFNNTKKILQQELTTYRDALKGRSAYQDTETGNQDTGNMPDLSGMSDDELRKIAGG